MTQFSSICGASPVNNQIIFFYGHDSHFGDRALIQMKYINIQPFVPKLGNSINNQPNDNAPNSKLKSLYNVAKAGWMLKYVTETFLPYHINYVSAKAWDTFKVSAGKIIRDSFLKTKLPPLRPPHSTTST